MLSGLSTQRQEAAGKPPESTLRLQLALLFGLIELQVTEKATRSNLRNKENLIHVPKESVCEKADLRRKKENNSN